MTQDPSEPRPAARRHPVVRGLWLALGLFFVALGIIGAMLPIMPTTIFLILATGCFTHSSPRLERWLLDHAHFGPPLRAWREQRAVSRAGKIAACSGMAIGYGMFLLLAQPRLAVALPVAAALAACAAWLATRAEPKPPGGG